MPTAFPLVTLDWLSTVLALCLGSNSGISYIYIYTHIDVCIFIYIFSVSCLQEDLNVRKGTCLELHAFPELENISRSMSPGY